MFNIFMNAKASREIVPTTSRLSPENREGINILAQQEDRTPSYFIRLAVKEFIERRIDLTPQQISESLNTEDSNKHVPVTFRMSSDNRSGIKTVAQQENCKPVDVIRLAITEFIERHEIS